MEKNGGPNSGDEAAQPDSDDEFQKTDSGDKENLDQLKLLQKELDNVLPDRYELKEFLGRGSYGLVLSAVDNHTMEQVAIKKIYPDVLNNPFLGTRVVREIKLLAHFDHPNIIGIQNLLSASERSKEKAWMVLDIMDMDLHALMKSGQTFTTQHIQFFLAQILSALENVHAAGVIHRDLTPANCLLNINCDLRICDFGLAREADADMTDYVVMRWYRAPELLMELPQYDWSVDIWAAGCILAQMLNNSVPLFTGDSTVNQLEQILDFVGTPSDEEIQAMGASPAAQTICRRRAKNAGVDPFEAFAFPEGGKISPYCNDLLQKLMAFYPQKRCTATEAVHHKFLVGCGYNPIPCEAKPFTIVSPGHDLEIHEVMHELRQLQKQKHWGGDMNVDMLHERLSSTMSQGSISAFEKLKQGELRTAMQRMSMASMNASSMTSSFDGTRSDCLSGSLRSSNSPPGPGGSGYFPGSYTGVSPPQRSPNVFGGIPQLKHDGDVAGDGA